MCASVVSYAQVSPVSFTCAQVSFPMRKCRLYPLHVRKCRFLCASVAMLRGPSYKN